MFNHNISFAGAGKVAAALSQKIHESGLKIDLIVSVSEANGRSLAESCGSSWSSELQFPRSTDIIIVAVPDQQLKSVIENIRCRPDTLVIHTAGSMGMDFFPQHLTRKGVFYPLQTFSVGRNVDFTNIPVLLESSDDESLALLKELAAIIGAKTYFLTTQQRAIIHLAAVYICNFSNHMFTLGSQICSKADVPFDIFYPLLQETVSKAMAIGPEKSQTGPAIRNDMNIIEKHLELLSFSPELQKIYREITLSIINFYNKS